MRGFRFGVVALIALALLFNDSPTSDGRGAILPQLSTTQTLRSWDGRGLAIPGPTMPVAESRAALKKLGGTRLVLKVDTDRLRKELLFKAQDDVRRAMRDARIGYKSLAIQDGRVEFSPRNEEDVPRALAAMAGSSVHSGKGLGNSVEVRNIGAGTIRLTLTETDLNERIDTSVVRALDTFSLRFNQFGLANSSVKQIGRDRIELLLPELTQSSGFFYHLFSHADLSFRLVQSANAISIPENRNSEAEVLRSHKAQTAYWVQKRIVASGQDLRTATALLDPQTRKPAVAFKLGGQGVSHLAKVTQENVGRSLAVVLGGEIFSAPLIQGSINDGWAKIQGNFTMQEALDLARFLRIGTFQAPLIVVDEEIVAAAKP